MPKSVVVFGDSVTWGQGFFPNQKFAKHVADALGAELRLHAHSGAVIGVNNHESGSCPPEAPRHTPTILQQLASNTDDPDEATLILLDGGINDISVQYILSPFTSDQGLKAKVERYCFEDMLTLLRAAIARFQNPRTNIIVTSYFPIFSPQSDFHRVLEYLSHGLFIAPPPAMMARAEEERFAIRSVELAMLFWQESRKQLRAAVDATRTDRVRFADVPFTEANAMFAPEPWLFNVHLEGLELKPEDPVATSRREDCERCHPNNPFDRSACDIASAGHPNFFGAEAFAKTILALAI